MGGGMQNTFITHCLWILTHISIWKHESILIKNSVNGFETMKIENIHEKLKSGRN